MNQENNQDFKNLAERIGNSLVNQKINEKMQRELAILVYFRSLLDGKNTKQIQIVNLAIVLILKKNNKYLKNQVFIHETRKQLAGNLRHCNLFFAMIEDNGNAYNSIHGRI